MNRVERIIGLLVVILVIAGVMWAYMGALDTINPARPRAMSETEQLRERVLQLAELVAEREEELEELAATLNGALAERNEAIALMHEAGLLPCCYWQEVGAAESSKEKYAAP